MYLPRSIERYFNCRHAKRRGNLLVALAALPLEQGLAVPVQAVPVQAVPVQAEPGEAVDDGVDGLLRRALAVGVLDAQQELPAAVARQQPVEQRGAGPTDMQEAGRRGGETGHEGAVLAHCRLFGSVAERGGLEEDGAT